MGAVLDILISLGVNKTVFAQFVIFIVAFLFLKIFIFSPYLSAYQERRKRTMGSVGVAKELQKEIDDLEAAYSVSAKQMNEKIKAIFDEKRLAAQKQTNQEMAQALTKAQESLQKGKQEVQESYLKAKEQMKVFVPELGQSIKQRLLDQ